jgi:hypothetical protein
MPAGLWLSPLLMVVAESSITSTFSP